MGPQNGWPVPAKRCSAHTLITQMADGCLECKASMCVWLAFSCREESVTTYIESVQKSQKCHFKCQYLLSKKQLETCFFLIHLFFHALSTGDDKSSLNTIDIQKMTWKYRYISRKIVFRLDLLSPVDRAWKNKLILKKQVSSCFLKEGIGI